MFQKRILVEKLIIMTLICLAGAGLAFCGFYVAKADTELFNESSKVIMARDGNRTILTMANDFKGEVSEFAMVVPIPYVFTQDQIQVGSTRIFDRIDAYSAPRLVEYFDDDPCMLYEYSFDSEMAVPSAAPLDNRLRLEQADLGVTIEESFSVGEYDILILRAEESRGLETWLLENDYNIPEGASQALAPYISMGMNFFVARVNLEAFESSGFTQLRPLIMAFESDSFMLPIQLGMVNANGPQDLIMFMLSPEGRIELENYQTINIPADINVPGFVENEFAEVYTAMFETLYQREGRNDVFLEYAWDMSWCDPCAADPLSRDELLQAGVFWLDGNANFNAPNVYLTRLHARYTPEEFHEDLVFRVTRNRENFQGRYVMQQPFEGEITCEAGQDYIKQVQERQQREAERLANLTGWSLASVQQKMTPFNPAVNLPNWWQRVFDLFD